MLTTVQKSARVLALAGLLSLPAFGASVTAQTPAAAGCQSVATPAAAATRHDHGSMHEATPETGGHHDHAGMEAEFDLMYIDMMIPHHQSIIALAEVAQHELTHPDLIAMAEDIVENQEAEIAELQTLRAEWYTNAAPVSMDAMHGMPGMSGDMDAMEQQMSAEWQVQTFCSAQDKDLAFVELVIPHHQMAIDTSEAALEHAEHQEIKDIAQRVIDVQQGEIDQLEAIREELGATPAARVVPSGHRVG